MVLTFHLRMMVQRITAAATLPPMTAITVIVVFETPLLDLDAPTAEADSEAEASAALALVTVAVKVGALEESASGAAVTEGGVLDAVGA